MSVGEGLVGWTVGEGEAVEVGEGAAAGVEDVVSGAYRYAAGVAATVGGCSAAGDAVGVSAEQASETARRASIP